MEEIALKIIAFIGNKMSLFLIWLAITFVATGIAWLADKILKPLED